MHMFGKILLVIGIAIVFVMVVMSGKELFYKGPQYSDYFGKSPEARVEITDQAQCEEVGGKWFEPGEDPRVPRPPVAPVAPVAIDEEGSERELAGRCDEGFEKREAFNKARDEHKRNAFIALMLIGIGTFIGGLVVTAIKATDAVSPSIGGGLAVGGIILSLIGTMEYWDDMNDLFRFILMSVALVLIITVGILIPRIMKRIQKN